MGDEMAEERDVGMVDLTDAEKEDILTMRNTPHLYNKVGIDFRIFCDSLIVIQCAIVLILPL